MSPQWFDNLEDRLSDVESRLRELAEQVEATWTFLTSRKLADLPVIRESLEGQSFRLFELDINRLARRIGFAVVKGEGFSGIEQIISTTLEATSNRALQAFLKKSLGASLLSDFATGAGFALIDTIFSAIKRGLKPRKLNLPLLEPVAEGLFPQFASWRMLFPQEELRPKSTHTTDRRWVSTYTTASEFIEKALVDRMSGFGG